MFKIKNATMNHQQFFQALNSIQTMALPTKIAWNIKKLFKEIRKAEADVREEVKAIGKECFKCDKATEAWIAKKDEEGNPIPGKYEELIPDGLEVFKKKTDELLQLEAEIHAPKINLLDIQNISMAPVHLQIIEDLIDDEATQASLNLV